MHPIILFIKFLQITIQNSNVRFIIKPNDVQSIHLFFFTCIPLELWEIDACYQRPFNDRWGTPWTDHQFFTGPASSLNKSNRAGQG